MDFVDQLGAERILSVNVGSGHGAGSRRLARISDGGQADVAREGTRARMGIRRRTRSSISASATRIGRCGGAMSADHYVEEMKRYAHYTRNLNPAQTGRSAMKRVAVGWDSGNDDYTEAVMKAWKNKNWAWDIEGVSLHGYTIPNSGRRRVRASASARTNMPRASRRR